MQNLIQAHQRSWLVTSCDSSLKINDPGLGGRLLHGKLLTLGQPGGSTSPSLSPLICSPTLLEICKDRHAAQGRQDFRPLLQEHLALTRRSIVPDSMDGPSNITNQSGLGLFSGSRDFVVNNSVIYGAHGVTDIVAQGMKALSEHVIKGAAYDSSLRDPPPQCHPGTRVQLREKVIVWFRNNEREKALFWLNGPAGVGKSAVIQTVAESLAESNSVGATLFFSKLNDRKDPQRVFITIAYQLATAIPAYKIYITERIAQDPNLLEKGMNDQFRIFIAEPFGNGGIGKEEGPWAVLLDGLDECEGVNEQSRIVGLVSGFSFTFPHAPLVWVIASRPEPHIVATFNDKAVAPSFWSEYLPINSTEACQDVEHYLDASFKAMRKPFPHLPLNWPSETQFLKLTCGALGLFAFAKTAVCFMEDPGHANPVSRLDLILSIIDRLNVKVIDDRPFALLDALYTEILSSIPASVWCTTKRILGFYLCTRTNERKSGLSYYLQFQCHLLRRLMIASTVLGLELTGAYGSLHKLHSVLKVSDSLEAHKGIISFLHASFGGYLVDRARSKTFYIDRGESVDDITHSMFQFYLDKPWDTNWSRYTSQLPKTLEPEVYWQLKRAAIHNLHYIVAGEFRSRRGRGPLKSQQDRSECLKALSRINLAEDYMILLHDTIAFLVELWNGFREELEHIGLFKEIPLRDLKVGHLGHEKNIPTFRKNSSPFRNMAVYEVPTITLREYQLSHSEGRVIICGRFPENRIAFVAGVYCGDEGYFCFPYPY